MIPGTVIELLVKRAWHWGLARIRRMRSADGPRETPATRRSSADRLPQEVVEMIIAQPIHDMQSLRVCSLTCFSWYIAAVPHLHHTLVTPAYPCRPSEGEQRFFWSKPLRGMYKLGLLPLVKNLQIRAVKSFPSGYDDFSPIRFNRRILHHFSALTDVRELAIEYLDIPSFMPRLQRYFGHFLPSVRSLALGEPKGSHRQIIYFIGLFQDLEDLKLIYNWDTPQDEPADEPTLVPPFAPPLRGRLELKHLTRVEILKDMIDLFGGIRFRHMDLYNVNGTRLLLDACAQTLETLRLYPTDPRGK